jgi:catechol 2,3-dioxygenase-like lactoylglutathione lyase family enzyme
MERMQVGHVEIPSSDPLRSLAFYRDVLGFALDVVQADRFVWMTSGGVTVLIRPGFESAPDDDLAGHNLVLYSDDLASDAARLREAGVAFTERASCLHFRDPDGHWLQLVDPGADHSG